MINKSKNLNIFMRIQPNIVMCLWEFVGDKKWKLVESFALDDDGYPITTCSLGNTRNCWDKWMFEKDNEPIMGRCITICDIAYGVQLHAFHPPKWTNWLSVNFIKNLKELINWSDFLHDGYDLRIGSANEMKKLIKC